MISDGEFTYEIIIGRKFIKHLCWTACLNGGNDREMEGGKLVLNHRPFSAFCDVS